MQEEKDTFGMADEDWDIYRGIQKDGGLSEEEDEDEQNLIELEEQIAEMDPRFSNLVYNTTSQPTAEDYQIRLWADRFKGAEILFQPSIIGLENAGLSEILDNILKFLSKEQKIKMLSYVLLMGGNSQIQGFDKRILAELTMLNPSDTRINVVKSYD